MIVTVGATNLGLRVTGGAGAVLASTWGKYFDWEVRATLGTTMAPCIYQRFRKTNIGPKVLPQDRSSMYDIP